MVVILILFDLLHTKANSYAQAQSPHCQVDDRKELVASTEKVRSAQHEVLLCVELAHDVI